MKKNILLVLLSLCVGAAGVHAESPIQRPPGKVNFSLLVPKDSADSLQPGQHIAVHASNGVKGKSDPAPVIQGAVVLDGLVLDIGKKVRKDGFVIVDLAITSSEAQNIKNAQAQKADLSIEILPTP